MISAVVDPAIEYPDATECFSPDERYPEYRYAHISAQKNLVYRAVRSCFIQAGLDRENFGTPAWNPLGKFIEPGSRVFLLCNFATERRNDELLENYRSRCSHGSIIRALIDYVLIAVGDSGSVRFGNAPTQFCHWQTVLKDTQADAVLNFYQSNGIPLEAKDLRLFVTDATQLGAIKRIERRLEREGVHVTLDGDSLFEELDQKQINRYRVMNYDPRRTASFHSQGHHEYVINREILEADVIFSTPKLKTHEKVGISCALKGMVGTVAHKDSLPHHRYGSPDVGGDEYPADRFGLMRIAAAFHERIQKTKPDTPWGSAQRAAFKVFRRMIRRWTPVVDGAWWGNDTAWRMVLDLARIATYANPAGEMQPSPCRKHIVLTDGILGGEGDGPAYATPVKSGTLTFADDLVLADFANAALMGFDPEKIPMIYKAAQIKKYPLLKHALENAQVTLNGHLHSLSELLGLNQYHFEPQDGWKDIL